MAITENDTEPSSVVRCTTCGMRADADPEFHSDRYAHWPTVRCQDCRSDIPYGGPNVCDRCDLHASVTP